MPIHELKLEIAKNTGPAICDRGLPGFCPHMFSRSFLMLSAFGCIWLVKNVEEHWNSREYSRMNLWIQIFRQNILGVPADPKVASIVWVPRTGTVDAASMAFLGECVVQAWTSSDSIANWWNSCSCGVAPSSTRAKEFLQDAWDPSRRQQTWQRTPMRCNDAINSHETSNRQVMIAMRLWCLRDAGKMAKGSWYATVWNQFCRRRCDRIVVGKATPSSSCSNVAFSGASGAGSAG